MSSEVRTGTIFISHASADIEQATEIYRRLKDRDYPVWMAVHEIKPGANYAEVILKTIDAAKAVIVLLSKDSIASDHVKREMSLARELQLPIYPVTFTDLAQLNATFGSDWKSWLDISRILQDSSPREATRSLIRELKSMFDQTSQKEALEKKKKTAILFEREMEGMENVFEISLSSKEWGIALENCLRHYQEWEMADDAIDTWQLLQKINK
jgi:hypothetical protein